jgi:hypothetical protein
MPSFAVSKSRRYRISEAFSASSIRLRSVMSLSGSSPPLPEGRLANLSSSSANRARKVAFSAMRWDFVLDGIYTPQAWVCPSATCRSWGNYIKL